MITIRIAPVLSRMFFAFILLVALLPFKLKFISLLGRELSYADILLFILFLILIPLSLKKLPSNNTSANTAAKLLFFILIYALISTLWTDFVVEYWYIWYQIFLAFLTISIPFLISKITNDKHVNYHKLISNLATIITFILLVYILKESDSDRLGGLIGGAAIISVILIPALAVHFHNILQRKRIIVSLACFLITSIGIFYTESRAGLIMLLLFIAITILRKPTIIRVFIITFIMIIFFIMFSDNISTERYESFEDTARSTMLDSSLSWWKKSTESFIFGNGYGEIWQWSKYQEEGVSESRSRWVATDHGRVMYHAHSIFNQLVAELGLIGLIPFVIFVIILLKEAWKSWREKNELKTNILVALICTLPTFHADLMIFRNWEVSIIWLFFFFTALRYIPKNDIAKVKKEKKLAA